MVLHLIPQKKELPTADFTPRITVIGVGGGGGNAVDTMIALDLQGVEFVVANTDAQQLQHSRADSRVQLGPHLTQGLGAGAKPEIGRAAAEEAADELSRHLDGVHLLFITAGMGGGTGTGAAPVIARMAREKGVVTVGVVTKPFTFEGTRRARAAELGIQELQQNVDTLIVIPNQNLFRVANERTGLAEAFKMADHVLYMGVRGITDLMVAPGIVNLDFADVRTVMNEFGKAMMGTGEAEGENRAVRAAEAAISNPLLEDTNMAGARGLLINISGGSDLTLFEVDQAANRVREEVADDAVIFFGSSIDESLSGRVRVSVVATGIDIGGVEQQRPRLVSITGAPVTAPFAPAAPAVAAPIPSQLLHPRPDPLETMPAMTANNAPSGAAEFAAGLHPEPRAEVRPELRQEARTAPRLTERVPLPVSAPRPAPQPPLSALLTDRPAGPPTPARNLLSIMTGGFRNRRTEPAPEAARTEPPRSEPTEPPAAPSAEPSWSEPRQVHPDEALEIPAFLRRQSS